MSYTENKPDQDQQADPVQDVEANWVWYGQVFIGVLTYVNHKISSASLVLIKAADAHSWLLDWEKSVK